jgi:hypothetical protein
MTTISQELDRLEHSIEQTLSSHHELLKLQQQQVECLTQLLNAGHNSSLDEHCLSAINRLTELLDRTQQANYQVYNVLSTLKQAKDARDLTIDPQGEVATCLKLELGALAQRLKIEPPTKLSTATNTTISWSKLMNAHPDPAGYQWHYPGVKRGLYHKTHLQVTGTKTVQLAPNTSLN